ncbi:amino acid permease/ SLC12A domain-containing protein [Penicillium citrinum]|uniref:Amino acid permease/ SLC12A domain-containing protein n=1 Tax=Penicillium citrinum TaxID=5077 RepID=A0A9W9P417_PENCI|nr:amino acid permease/ SLC12A domain-containing protein [Penicillium citrinum]KAJ5234720.1 amino acid permease/ SLC12A domain-containing protein [Penicillium citrinum]
MVVSGTGTKTPKDDDVELGGDGSMKKQHKSWPDIADAESSETTVDGNVQRELKARHVTFIALGGNLGTGLFLGIGHALRVGAVITLCAEISAACSILQFWSGAEDINVAVWIVVLIVFFLVLNILAVHTFGEFEFICAVIKLCGIIGLLILALCIDLGGVSGQPRLGFHYWKTAGIMKEYIATGAEGRFLGYFYTLINAQFAINGCETVVVAAGEAENPRRNIPRAIKRVFWRLLFFYVCAALALSMICPSGSPNLMGGDRTAQSPWVIAVNIAGIKALPSVINGLILVSAVSSGNSYVFMGTRYLYVLAQNEQAPRIFLRCTKQGIPIWCLLVTMSISFISFMSVGSDSSTAFQWFQNLATVATV